MWVTALSSCWRRGQETGLGRMVPRGATQSSTALLHVTLPVHTGANAPAKESGQDNWSPLRLPARLSHAPALPSRWAWAETARLQSRAWGGEVSAQFQGHRDPSKECPTTGNPAGQAGALPISPPDGTHKGPGTRFGLGRVELPPAASLLCPRTGRVR